jgi:hypothetical protein
MWQYLVATSRERHRRVWLKWGMCFHCSKKNRVVSLQNPRFRKQSSPFTKPVLLITTRRHIVYKAVSVSVKLIFCLGYRVLKHCPNLHDLPLSPTHVLGDIPLYPRSLFQFFPACLSICV